MSEKNNQHYVQKALVNKFAIEQYNYYSVILKSKKSYAHFIPQLKKMPELVPIE